MTTAHNNPTVAFGFNEQSAVLHAAAVGAPADTLEVLRAGWRPSARS